MSYTPGPWRVAREGRAIGIRPGKTGWLIATVNEHQPICEDDPAGHCEANAKLIAAAPELLAALVELTACKDMKDMLEANPRGNESIQRAYDARKPVAWQAAYAAIAKATS